jgi:hypothetical protein
MHRISTGKSGKLAEILGIVDNWSIRLWITRVRAGEFGWPSEKDERVGWCILAIPLGFDYRL